jgi:hypothetical protein
VPAGAGDFEGALGSLLSANVFEIHREMLRLVQSRLLIDSNWEYAVSVFRKWTTSISDFARVPLLAN